MPYSVTYQQGTIVHRDLRWAPTDGWAISLASARILARLSDNGPSRISDLAELEHCTHPAISNHVKRLEAANLVSRRTDPTDARAWVIELTEAAVLRPALSATYLRSDGQWQQHQPCASAAGA
jgi:DNA-binding MarR family transcriptional regulator